MRRTRLFARPLACRHPARPPDPPSQPRRLLAPRDHVNQAFARPAPVSRLAAGTVLIDAALKHLRPPRRGASDLQAYNPSARDRNTAIWPRVTGLVGQ